MIVRERTNRWTYLEAKRALRLLRNLLRPEVELNYTTVRTLTSTHLIDCPSAEWVKDNIGWDNLDEFLR